MSASVKRVSGRDGERVEGCDDSVNPGPDSSVSEHYTIVFPIPLFPLRWRLARVLLTSLKACRVPQPTHKLTLF